MQEITLQSLAERVNKLEDAVFGDNAISLQSNKMGDIMTLLGKASLKGYQKILICGHYLICNKKKEYFTSKDIDDLMYEANNQSVANISDAILKCVRKGYLMKARGTDDLKGKAKAYKLTNEGIAEVDALLSVTSQDKNN